MAASLFQRALAEVDAAPSDIVDLAGPDRIREIAADMLRQQGCKLECDPRSLEFLLMLYEDFVLKPALREWHSQIDARPKKGRPRRSIVDATIYTAAVYRFRGKVPEYYAAAAGWLGEPATKDKVEKGERFFRQVIGRTAETQRVLLHLLIDTIAELDRLDREAKQESANQASRRKAARYASFSART